MITLAQISDIHFGDADPGVLREARSALHAIAPACLVVTGDITQAGRKREFKEAADWFEGITTPVVACPGNHDAPVYAPMTRIAKPFARFRALGLNTFWSSQDGRAAAAAFNSARAVQLRPDWSQGVYALSDVASALKRCADAAPQGWRVLACHHPPVTPSGSPLLARTRNGALGVHALRASPRTILLSGHVHAFTLSRRGEALLVTAPSLASSRERGDGLGFNVLRLNEAEAVVERWKLGPNGFASDQGLTIAAGSPAGRR